MWPLFLRLCHTQDTYAYHIGNLRIYYVWKQMHRVDMLRGDFVRICNFTSMFINAFSHQCLHLKAQRILRSTGRQLSSTILLIPFVHSSNRRYIHKTRRISIKINLLSSPFAYHCHIYQQVSEKWFALSAPIDNGERKKRKKKTNRYDNSH